MERLKELEQKEELIGLSDNELIQVRILQKKIGAFCKQIQIKWWSKERRKWIDEDEKNSKYYHNLVKLKRSRAKIEVLVTEEKALTEDKEIVDGFASWYEMLWKHEETSEMECVLNRLPWNKIYSDEAKKLCSRFDMKEIWQAINGVGR
ncbi:non-LTR retrolelement reverse transcriptase [Canna indica]|uniref:Non-LTR retrolelement reverse transcriptase n=1 Tax=Canna indica TaxID=4628 RepID=A0AAQ3Q9A2_9LILI|nr:non-LTR retrolelement reverse transcriptase [Canna indica]